MRVVLDTNVLVSAVVFGGPPGRIIGFASQGRLRLVLSPATIDEFRRVLRGKFRFPDAAVYRAETLLRKVSLPVVEPEVSVDVLRDDPDDNRVLEAAIAGSADCIVSGDRHLLELESFRGIPILTPREFLGPVRMEEEQLIAA